MHVSAFSLIGNTASLHSHWFTSSTLAISTITQRFDKHELDKICPGCACVCNEKQRREWKKKEIYKNTDECVYVCVLAYVHLGAFVLLHLFGEQQ